MQLLGLTSEGEEVLKHVGEQLDLHFQKPLSHQENAKWTQEQWWQAFDFLSQQTISSGLDINEPFSVRRKCRELEAEWQIGGTNFKLINWMDTLLLNLVVHAQYILTAIACSQDQLPQVAEGLTHEGRVSVVSKRVYASPVHTTINLGNPDGRSSTSCSKPCYPDVCFAIENFSETFNKMVLCNPDDCYCVVMHALLPSEENGWNTRGEGASSSSSKMSNPTRLTLFSGYVTFGQIEDHIKGIAAPRHGNLLKGLFSGSSPVTTPPRERIMMAGPGGLGKAEVAVSKAGAQDNTKLSAALSGAMASFFGVVKEKPSLLTADGSIERLQCALISMRFPVDKLASNLLTMYKKKTEKNNKSF